MKKTAAVFICFIFIKAGMSQPAAEKHTVNFTSSNLPVISIQTHGQKINENRQVTADMEIAYNGEGSRNPAAGPFNHYRGKINIEIRGYGSAKFPKKSYNIETLDAAHAETHVSLLGMPAESDWVLLAPYDDKSLMRNVMAYKMSREMGRYASRTVFAELLLNGEYCGIYVLEEKIKISPHRVPVHRLTPADTSGNAVTGGYILKIDRAESYMKLKTLLKIISNPVKSKVPVIKNKYGLHVLRKKKRVKKHKEYIVSPYLPMGATWQGIQFKYHDPVSKDLAPQQVSYIEDFMLRAESSLADTNFTHPQSGYRKYLVAASFIDFFIVNEVARNVDGYRLSTYFYKDRDSADGRLTMGPVWDFNISMGNSNSCQGMHTSGWTYDFNTYCSSHAWLVPFWWERLLQDTLFANELKCRWVSLRKSTLSTGYMMSSMDSLATLLDEAQQRNFKRWELLGTKVGANTYVFKSYSEEVNYLKQWLAERLQWLDLNMPGNCNGHME